MRKFFVNVAQEREFDPLVLSNWVSLPKDAIYQHKVYLFVFFLFVML